MDDTFSIRPATLDDLDAIVRHRRLMFTDMGYRDEAALDSMEAEFRPWVRQKMESGEYLGWLAIASDNSVAAGAGLWLMDWPPHMIGAGSRRGNIVNVYTEHQYRLQGLARRLMKTTLDWCRGNGVRAVILHASEQARGLYLAIGFRPSNEMRLTLEGVEPR